MVPTFGITLVPPFVGSTVVLIPPTVNVETVIVSPSKSESLLKTPFAAFTFKTTSSATVFVSATNVGVSFTAVTVMSNVLVAKSVPSVAV